MVLYYAEGSKTTSISNDELKLLIQKTLSSLNDKRPENQKFKRVAIVPPDFTRYHSKSGIIAQYAYEYLKEAVADVMPALGTHAPMTNYEIEKMFGTIPKDLFRIHDWRNDVVTIGHVPASLVQVASDGQVNEPWPAQLNKLLWEGEHDLILSIGQVVPHEVLGMANYNKNLFVGTGGADAINFSHFIGAVYGMERMMGRANNPLRQILNYASENFIKHLPIIYIQTVIAPSKNVAQKLETKGVFIGDDDECFLKAATLSMEVNFQLLDAPLDKVVVYLDPEEFKSTWLGNKAIYRTRMAIADGGELIILAPGIEKFGEDKTIDILIRKYGYRTTPEVLQKLQDNRDLMKNLSAVAHLIHGSSENRFQVTYCPGKNGLSRAEIESVGFSYGNLDKMTAKYCFSGVVDGFNRTVSSDSTDEEEFFYISNPALGLWAYRGRFEVNSTGSPSTNIEERKDETSLVYTNDSESACMDAGVGGGPFKHS